MPLYRIGTAAASVVDALKSTGAALNLTGAGEKMFTTTVNDDGSSTSTWPNRLEFFFKTVAQVSRRTFYLNEYGEVRVIPAKVSTVAVRIFTKEFVGDANHSAGVAVLEVMDDRDTRTSLFSVVTDGTVAAKNVQHKVVAVPTGTSGFATQPDGTLWVEYTP